jgi:hypothetical protein
VYNKHENLKCFRGKNLNIQEKNVGEGRGKGWEVEEKNGPNIVCTYE